MKRPINQDSNELTAHYMPEIQETVNWRNTILLNIPWFIMLILSFLFLGTALSIITRHPDPLVQVLAVIATLFFALKFFAFAGYPTIYWEAQK